MDIFWLEAVVAELAETVIDTRINKIHQPTPDTIILKLWNGQRTLRLLLSVDGRFSRLHLTERDYPNPFTPLRFCQLLRSRLSALTGLRQISGERVVEFSFRGKEKSYFLFAELFGRRGNLILTDENRNIIDLLWRSRDAESDRSLLPGSHYRLPERPQGVDLRRCLPELPQNLHTVADFRRWLLLELSPMSPVQARLIAEEGARLGNFQGALHRFRTRLLQGELAPRIISCGPKTELRLFTEDSEAAELQTFASVSEALDTYYYPLQFESGKIGDRRELEVLVRRQLKKLRRRRENIMAEKEQKGEYELFRTQGELLLSSLHLVQRGMTEVVVMDYHQHPPQQVTIPLDPKRTPQENAEICFTRYKKAKRGLEHIERRLRETDAELDWCEGMALALDEAQTPVELDEVRRELTESGMIRPLRSDRVARASRPVSAGPHRTLSPSGLVVLWGRNNRTNDEVSLRHTGKDDLWFHVHNRPGCHLVLKRGGHKGDLPEEDILFAASLAAGYSRARNDHKVEVMVAEGSAVRKPKGARPGLVTVGTYHSLVVNPRRLEENEL